MTHPDDLDCNLIYMSTPVVPCKEMADVVTLSNVLELTISGDFRKIKCNQI